ncbi:MAG: hypothetical protein MJ137_08680 [Clostridia bacterium]|nr:hypothetical protein [Clostridia bacterium]
MTDNNIGYPNDTTGAPTDVTEPGPAETTEAQEVTGSTPSGFSFTFSGAKSYKDGVFYFGKEPLRLLFDAADSSFNCFSLKYSASAPLKCTAVYSIDGREISDVFWLESGENKTFTSLIDRYTEGKSARNPSSVTFEPMKGTNQTFSLADFGVSQREKCPGNEVFAEAFGIKLGIRLEWGGGISYYEDKNDGDDSISNLLNSHDTGRLVQQSYYGSSSAPYEPGTYNGTVWSYNPVQGGNLFGEKSRLIDYSIAEDGSSVHVKCLPRDWAKKGIYSMSYMENTYTIRDGYVSVDNRFTDFSGYIHPQSHQELPAFYTISSLSDFSFYGGSSAWKDLPLTVKSDLPFWGGNPNAYFTLKSKETFCAWTSPETGFGIGVYSPIATILLAGKYNYNGTKDPKADPTNYVAPLITKKLESFVPFEYSYYIASGTADSIRSCFKTVSGH